MRIGAATEDIWTFEYADADPSQMDDLSGCYSAGVFDYAVLGKSPSIPPKFGADLFCDINGGSLNHKL